LAEIELSMDEAEVTKVIEEYGMLMEKLTRAALDIYIYDEKHLPHPKSVIRNGLYLKLQQYPYELCKKVEGGIEMYKALLNGALFLPMFQKDLGVGQFRIPNSEQENLGQLDKERAKSMVNFIDSILQEIKETLEQMHKLNINIEPENELNIDVVGQTLLLGLARGRLKERITKTGTD